MRRKVSAALISFSLAVTLLTGCGSISSDSELTMSKKVKVESQEASIGTLEIVSTYIANIDPINSVAVTPLVSGVVKTLKVKVGDRVKKGQVLCKFDDKGAALTVQNAEDAVASARAGKKAAQSQQAAASAQSDASIATTRETLKGYKTSLKKAKKQLKEARKAKKQIQQNVDKTRKAYEKANKLYKTAETIYLNFKGFLDANPDCRTTAGLTAAANGKKVPAETPAQANVPGQNGTDAGQTGTDAGQAGGGSSQTGTDASLAGSDAGQAGTAAGQTGTDSGQAGSDASQAGTDSGQTGSDVSQAGTDSGQTGNDIGQAGTDTSQAGSGENQETADQPQASTDQGTGSDIGSSSKQQTAALLLKTLNDAGLTVEYISETGLKILSENVEETKTLFTNASSGSGQMDSSIATLESTVDQLQAQVDVAKANIKASKKAVEAASAGTGVYDAQIRAAETGVESARYQQSLYTITAPISGIIETVNVSKDEMAPQGVPAFSISEKKTMEASFYVTEDVKNYLKVGDPVRTEVDEEGNYSPGRIIGIDTAVDPQKGLFRVQAEIRPADRSDFSSGTSVNLLVVSNSAKNQILIPYDAVYYENGQAYVFVIKNGVAVRKNVETGIYDSKNIVITDGLSAGNRVVTSWASGLKDGAEVEIMDSSSGQKSKDTEEADHQK